MDSLIPIVASGLLGALSVLLGQLVSGYFSAKRHREDLSSRERERWIQFLVPVAQRRLAAYEQAYDLLQGAIEGGTISVAQYVQLRPNLLYLEAHIRSSLVTSVEGLVRAVRTKDETLRERAIEDIRKCQSNLEIGLGLGAVGQGIQAVSAAIEKRSRE